MWLAAAAAEDREVTVDGFAGSGQGDGILVKGGDDQFCAGCFEGTGGEFVFAVEVAGDDEETVVAEPRETVLEDASPCRGVVPEVLVAEEGEVEVIAERADPVELRAVGGDEFGIGELACAGAGGGFFEFAAADVGTDEADGWGSGVAGAQGFHEGACFAAGPAGEVEDLEGAGRPCPGFRQRAPQEPGECCIFPEEAGFGLGVHSIFMGGAAPMGRQIREMHSSKAGALSRTSISTRRK